MIVVLGNDIRNYVENELFDILEEYCFYTIKTIETIFYLESLCGNVIKISYYSFPQKYSCPGLQYPHYAIYNQYNITCIIWFQIIKIFITAKY